MRIADPPFSKLDLISCRNLLIYLESNLQDKVLRLFHFALKPNSFLLLGSSESLGARQREFRTLSKKWRIFQPEGPSPLGLMEVPMSREAGSSIPRFLAQGLGRREPNLADIARQALVETFAPASVLVTRRHQVLYVYGDTSDYLSQPQGELTDDLLAMTRQKLRTKTRAALHQAIGENRQVTLHGAGVERGDTLLPVTITATPLHQPPPVAGLLLVSFHQEPEASRQAPVPDLGPDDPEAAIVHQMEDELRTTREELQSTIEELETSNEELKASNEEVMSMNEELQSSNEELETSKEELQSLNEELTTVNHQLQNKIVEVESTNNDLSNLLASSNIATLFLDRELRIKRFTPTTTRLMNLIPADVGRPVADIANRYANNTLKQDCLDVLDDLRPVERELLSQDGDWYIRRVQPYRTRDNRIEGTVVTFSDVTAMKLRDEEHARLASIVDSSETTIIGMTLEGIITSWNPGAEATFGHRADEVIGKSLDPLFPNRDPAEAARILEQILAGQRVGPYETEGRRKDKSNIQLSVSVSPIHDTAGQVIAASTIARDITKRKQVEQALADADRRKNEFLAILGHELRNPLTPIRNAIQILGRQVLPGPIQWAVDMIGRQSAQLERLVNDLIDVVRVTDGHIQLHSSPIDVQQALDNALESVASLAEQSHQRLETRLPDTPVIVMADPVRLSQVCANLLHNAVKYTPAGGHILVSLQQDGADAVLRVRDDGIGIRAEDQSHLFELFSRGDTSQYRLDQPDGLGVGLALAKQLVERQEGTLKVYSDGPGAGSEFVVRMPTLSQRDTIGSAPGDRIEMEAPAPARRVLVVDDNPDVADSFKVLLEVIGHQVRVLHSGLEAVETIRTFRPDAVFLDIGMPERDGYQVASDIRAARFEPCPLLVALTGYGQENDRKLARDAGFDHHLLKPPDPQEIELLLAGLRVLPSDL